MKKNQTRLLIGGIFVLILLAFFTFSIGNNTFSVIDSDVSGKVVTYYSPDFVQLDCAVVDAGVQEEYASFQYAGDGTPQETYSNSNSYSIIPCDDFTKKCEFSALVTSDVEDLTTLCGTYFETFRCDGDSCTSIDFDLLSRNQKVPIADLNPGEELRVRAWYNSGFLCRNQNNIPNDVFQITKEFDSYGLVVQGDTRLVKKEGNCDIPTDVRNNVVKAIDGLLPDSPSGFVYDEVPSKLSFQEVGRKKSYISYINEYNPLEQSRVYDYKGKEVYCSGIGALYEFGEITTFDGNTRNLAPTTFLETVECCPYQNGCTKDFEWSPEDESSTECISDLECFGGTFAPSGNKEISKQECVAGQCIVTETKVVECSGRSDCPGGICDIDSWSCVYGNIPEAYCGDGVCDGLENQFSCADDCGFSDDTNSSGSFNFILFGISIIIGGIVTYFGSLRIPKSKDKVTTAIRWFVILVIFIAATFVVAWIGKVLIAMYLGITSFFNI